ncbi:MAG: ribonuclease P protein component [Bacteroidetes bacterium]|nr:ribonuclease P protein component [Bacteroidota bacterium]MBU1371256.1 ribonuclease P protein component [Bacteroidota bacterium]MBU1485743.1 ribonuclease P protein component [Bacteroidota bacterium]MBU1760185.1 ribonuclease P protein component [Bacteroidota bacterium]MBU2047257.1 ribonuclease P protein component [Bacteroidota bacterium]
MASKIYSFQKEERLCSKKLLKELFNSGSSFLLYPFRVTWIHSSSLDQDFPVQLLTAVPKKRFKSSVERNAIKRKIKEAYRMSKGQYLYPELQNHKILLSLNYVGNQIHDFDFIQKKLLATFSLLLKKLEEHENH